MRRFIRPIAGTAMIFGILASGSMAHAAQDQRIGDWKLVCPEGAQAQASGCLITQRIVSTENDLGIAAVAVGIPKGQKRPMIAFNLAPQIDPAKPLGVKVDQQKTLYLPISGCDPQKCTALANLRDDLLDQLRKGNQAVLSFSVPGQEKPAGIIISLKGFTAAYKALEAKQPG